MPVFSKISFLPKTLLKNLLAEMNFQQSLKSDIKPQIKSSPHPDMEKIIPPKKIRIPMLKKLINRVMGFQIPKPVIMPKRPAKGRVLRTILFLHEKA